MGRRKVTKITSLGSYRAAYRQPAEVTVAIGSHPLFIRGGGGGDRWSCWTKDVGGVELKGDFGNDAQGGQLSRPTHPPLKTRKGIVGARIMWTFAGKKKEHWCQGYNG